MGIQLIGSDGNIIGGGETADAPLHTAQMPSLGNWYRYSGYTNTIPAALAANSEVFQFRFLSGSKTLALVYRVVLEGFALVTAATAAGPLGFELVPARGWTVAGTSGTRIATTLSNLKTRTSLVPSQINDIGIATSGAALGVGTKTLDANAQGGGLISIGTGAVTTFEIIATGPADMYSAPDGGNQPLVLANQEGFVIRTTHIGPATLTYAVRFGVVWVEVADF